MAEEVSTEPKVDELVEAYLEVRSHREQLAKEYDAADKALEQDLDRLSAAMLGVCNTLGVDSMKTRHGTIMRKLSEKFGCSDWGGLHDFILEHRVPEILEKRLHQGNLRQFLSQHEDSGLPPGVNVYKEFTISVRKSNS